MKFQPENLQEKQMLKQQEEKILFVLIFPFLLLLEQIQKKLKMKLLQ
jgi:hypothetical protein